jgi:hypothetical protein
MAQIAGWQPDTTPVPTPVLTATPNRTATPTRTATPAPTGMPTPTPAITPEPSNTPSPGTVVYVGDLDRTSNLGATGRWSARVTILVHSDVEVSLPGTVVSGVWSNGATGTATCTTNAAGSCNVSANGLLLDSVASVTFTVSELNLADYSYAPASNHDPDGDSDGTQIIVFKP